MARSILHLCLLLTIIYGQSNAAAPRCVYTFNVPASGCDQTPGSSVDDLVWKNSVIQLQAQVQQLARVINELTSDNRKLTRDVENLQKKLASSNTGRTKMSQILHAVPALEIVSTRSGFLRCRSMTNKSSN